MKENKIKRNITIVKCLIFLIILIIFVSTFLYFYNLLNSKELSTIKCSININAINYQIESSYEISYRGRIVEKTINTSKVISSNSKTLKEQKQAFINMNTYYENMNKLYGGYSYEVKSTNNTVSNIITIDYTKVDLEKLIKNDSNFKKLVNSNNQMLISKVQKTYEIMGANCIEVK